MARAQGLRGDPRGVRGPPALRPARRPAVRERRHPHRPRRQQDPQGRHRQEPHAGRLRRAVRAGLGLPRHADRGADREDARQAHPGGRDAAPCARLRDRADRAAEEGLRAAGRARRLGPSVHDDGVQERGGRDPHARQAAGKGLRLSRPEAGQLVLRLRQRAGRGRGRVRGPAGHRHRRRVPDRRRRPRPPRCGVRPAGAARRRGDGGDLDDDAVDDPRQPGAERASGVRLRAGRDAARPPGAGDRTGRRLPRTLQARRPRRRDREGRGAREPALPPPVLRPRVAGLPRRLRDAGAGHRHRPQLAGVRHRGLPVLPPLRHEGRRHAEPGAGRRPLRREPAVLRRPQDLGREPEDRRQARRGRRAAVDAEVHAQLHALLAPQDAGDLPRDDAVVRRHGRRAGIQRHEARAVAAADGAGGHRGDAVLPGLGQAAPLQHDREPPRLDAVAPAPVGRADAVLRAQGDRRAASAHARAARDGRRSGSSRAASRPGRA